LEKIIGEAMAQSGDEPRISCWQGNHREFTVFSSLRICISFSSFQQWIEMTRRYKNYKALITSVTINKAHPMINNRPTIFLAAVTKSNIKYTAVMAIRKDAICP